LVIGWELEGPLRVVEDVHDDVVSDLHGEEDEQSCVVYHSDFLDGGHQYQPQYGHKTVYVVVPLNDHYAEQLNESQSKLRRQQKLFDGG
jgi:hypothetical protein